MCNITAKAKFNGQKLENIPVLNAGDWFGKTWHIELGGNYWPLFLVVEADTISEAIDELAENEKYGYQIVVAEADLGDYPEDDRHYGASGQVLDLDHVMIHGTEGVECPFACTYHGEGLPPEGMKPTDFWRKDDD